MGVRSPSTLRRILGVPDVDIGPPSRKVAMGSSTMAIGRGRERRVVGYKLASVALEPHVMYAFIIDP